VRQKQRSGATGDGLHRLERIAKDFQNLLQRHRRGVNHSLVGP
jgi:hypothetical protein